MLLSALTSAHRSPQTAPNGPVSQKLLTESPQHRVLGVVWLRQLVSFQRLFSYLFLSWAPSEGPERQWELALLCVACTAGSIAPVGFQVCSEPFFCVCFLHCFLCPLLNLKFAFWPDWQSIKLPRPCFYPSSNTEITGFFLGAGLKLCTQACRTSPPHPLIRFLGPYFCFLYSCSFLTWKYLRQKSCSE